MPDAAHRYAVFAELNELPDGWEELDQDNRPLYSHEFHGPSVDIDILTASPPMPAPLKAPTPYIPILNFIGSVSQYDDRVASYGDVWRPHIELVFKEGSKLLVTWGKDHERSLTYDNPWEAMAFVDDTMDQFWPTLRTALELTSIVLGSELGSAYIRLN